MASASDSLVEDFSFPATATSDSPPHFIGSPPLWRTTPNSSPSHIEKHENWKAKEERSFSLNSFQELYSKSRSTTEGRKSFSSFADDDDDGCNEDEKMDLLWEDLNDEFSRNFEKKARNSADISSPGKDVRVSCVKAIKLSKANRNTIAGKKPNILVFIKVLKKLFVLQNNSRRSVNKHAWL